MPTSLPFRVHSNKYVSPYLHMYKEGYLNGTRLLESDSVLFTLYFTSRMYAYDCVLCAPTSTKTSITNTIFIKRPYVLSC